MKEIVDYLSALVWGNALVCLALGVGLYFTVITRGVQIRLFFEMIKLLKENEKSPDGISSFQAFCMALSGRVGVGNIAGVATAIAAGGPGALFWMIIMALLGGASAFVESTLAQIYKSKLDHQYRGGSPYYIEKGLRLKPFAIVAALVICISYGFLVPGIQANTITDAFKNTFKLPEWGSALIIVGLMGFLIFGGIKRLASFADKVVPLMAIGYIVLLIVILSANYEKIPAMFSLIVSSAVGTNAIFGGIVGFAVSWGVRRSVFSNVAGAGEATFSSAAAEVSHPVKQGLVQAFSIYIDTIVVCTATGLMILITNMYNVQPAGFTAPIVAHVPSLVAGTAWTQAAVSTVFSHFGSASVAFAIFMFAFTTLMAYYYIAETTLVYLDKKLHYPWLKFLLKIIFLAVLLQGCLQSSELMWGLGDIGFGSMCYINFIAIVLLTKPVLRALKDYEQQRKQGKNPVFDPRKVGIKNALFWEDYADEKAKNMK